MANSRDTQAFSSYDMLLKKLDSFIRKYYTNKILRGALITVGLCVALFLIYAFLEDQFYMSRGGRKVLSLIHI